MKTFSVLLFLLVPKLFFAQNEDVTFIYLDTIHLHNNDEYFSFLFDIKFHHDGINEKYIVNVVEFKTLLSSGEVQRLKKNKISIHEYVSQYSYISTMPLEFENNLFEKFQIRRITPISIFSKIISEKSERTNYVILNCSYFKEFKDVEKELINLNAEILEHNRNYSVLKIKIHRSRIKELLALSVIKFVEESHPPSNENHVSRGTLGGYSISNGIGLINKYDGGGVNLAINDSDGIGDHIDFSGRIKFVNDREDSHATHISGILGGAGNLNPLHQGFASQADLFSYGNSSAYGDFPFIYTEKGIRIINTSQNDGCNVYTTLSNRVDLESKNLPGLLFIFSAGNQAANGCPGISGAWYSITGGDKMGKNVITVGNLTSTDEINSTSSKGPANDNRIKPDICAMGTGIVSCDLNNTYSTKSGTSMAAPAISGLTALMMQAYKETHGGQEPDGGLMKAILLNTATDLGNEGPDFTYGWGKANGLRAIQAIEADRFRDSTISHGETHLIDLEIPAGVEKARIMLYWTDKEGSPMAAKALVNNLDLRLLDTVGNSYLPWAPDPGPNATGAQIAQPAQKGVDTLNNVEQVEIIRPQAGTYQIEIKGTKIPFPQQKYFIVYEWIKDEITILFPAGKESLLPNESHIIRWDAPTDSNATFDIHYTLDNGRNWTQIGANIPATQRYYFWNTPQAISGQARVRVTRGPQSSESQANFTLIETPANIQFARVCQDFVTLTWDAVPGATAYDIFVLGEKYMDSVGTTTHTFFEPKIRYQNENWFSVRARGDSGIVGRRAIAVKQDAGMLMSCAGVAPTANFILDTVLCDSQWVFLQDRSGKSPDSWQWTVIPSAGVSFIQNTADSSANPVISFADTGRYQITLKAISQFGADSITQTLRITSCITAHAPAFEPFSLQVTPNPNTGIFQLRMEGQLSGWYQLELLDLQGKKLLERSFHAQAEQLVQEIDVRELSGGVYFLRVGDGRRAVVRKLILR